MRHEKAEYIAYCIVKDFEDRLDELQASDIALYTDEYDSGWRLHESGNGFLSPEGRHIRSI